MSDPQPRNSTVFVRMRHFTDEEAHINATRSVASMTREGFVGIEDGRRAKTFKYDGCFHGLTSGAGGLGPSAPPELVTSTIVSSMMQNVMAGIPTLLMTYGQSGTGQDTTILGDAEHPGALSEACSALFEQPGVTVVSVSALELYCENLNNLMADRSAWPSSGLRVKLAKEGYTYDGSDINVAVQSLEETKAAFEKATMNRTTPDPSSRTFRSHMLYTLNVERAMPDGKRVSTFVTIALLAGNERPKRDAGVTGEVLREGSAINMSLSALGNCIVALSTPGKRAAFRDSKLTLLLQLGLTTGRVITVAHISPASLSFQETWNTLLYAERFRQIKTVALPKDMPNDTAAPISVTSAAPALLGRVSVHLVLQKPTTETTMSNAVEKVGGRSVLWRSQQGLSVHTFDKCHNLGAASADGDKLTTQAATVESLSALVLPTDADDESDITLISFKSNSQDDVMRKNPCSELYETIVSTLMAKSKDGTTVSVSGAAVVNGVALDLLGPPLAKEEEATADASQQPPPITVKRRGTEYVCEGLTVHDVKNPDDFAACAKALQVRSSNEEAVVVGATIFRCSMPTANGTRNITHVALPPLLELPTTTKERAAAASQSALARFLRAHAEEKRPSFRDDVITMMVGGSIVKGSTLCVFAVSPDEQKDALRTMQFAERLKTFGEPDVTPEVPEREKTTVEETKSDQNTDRTLDDWSSQALVGALKERKVDVQILDYMAAERLDGKVFQLKEFPDSIRTQLKEVKVNDLFFVHLLKVRDELLHRHSSLTLCWRCAERSDESSVTHPMHGPPDSTNTHEDGGRWAFKSRRVSSALFEDANDVDYVLAHSSAASVRTKAAITKNRERMARCEGVINKLPQGTDIDDYCVALSSAVKNMIKDTAMALERSAAAPPQSPMLQYFVQLPVVLASNPATKGISYPDESVRMVLLKYQRMLRLLLADEENPEFAAWMERFRKNQTKGIERKQAISDYEKELSVAPSAEWVQHFHNTGVDPVDAMEFHFAMFLYTVDAKYCACTTLAECDAKQKGEQQLERSKGKDYVTKNKLKHRQAPQPPEDPDAHGLNSAPWAVANWTVRVASDHSTDEEVRKKAEDTIQVYRPFITKLEEALSVLPQARRVVFRGVPVPLGRRYQVRQPVVFPPFSSTSLIGTEALQFLRKRDEGCFFILVVHKAAMIQFASWFPEQAESLVNTFSRFEVKRKMSPTLLRMLGCSFDVVYMTQATEEGEPPVPPQVKVDALIRASHQTTFIYDQYRENYIQARLKPLRERGGDSTATSAQAATTSEITLYSLLKAFVNKTGDFDHGQHMALLGQGGTGKTSAALAAICWLSAEHPETVYPLFIPLPTVTLLLTTPYALDNYLFETLDILPDELDLLLAQRQVILLLDSLDECRDISAEGLSSWLLSEDVNPYAGRCRVIISCRIETFPPLGIEPEDVLGGTEACSGFVVQPFNDVDISAYGYTQGRLRTSDHVKAKRLVSQLSNLSFDGADAMKRNPVTLHMLVRILLEDGPDGLSRSKVYARFIEVTLGKQLIDIALPEMCEIASRMLAEETWQLSVGDIQQSLADTDIRRLPCRLENASDPNSNFAWWHKSIGEYLCAVAAYRDPNALIENISYPFSRRSPAVVQFFSYIAREELSASTKKEILDCLVSFAEALSFNRNEDAIVSARGSNALALLVSAGVPLEDIDLAQDTVVEDCDLSQANLDHFDAEKLTLRGCLLPTSGSYV